MRTLILLLFFLFGITSLAQTINADSLDLRDGIGYARGAETPYTGTVVVINEIGTKESSVEYKDGQPHGKLSSWYLNGTKQVEGELYGTVQAGIWRAWYENGQLKRQGAFKDGKEEGLYTWYFEDGRTSKEGAYREGVETGVWSWYHENGRLMQQGELNGDTSVGVWKEWHPDGSPRMIGGFLGGEKHGEWTWWDAQGKKSTKTYTHGSITHATDSVDLYLERMGQHLEKRDLHGALAQVDHALQLVEAPSEGDARYMWLRIFKAKVYAQFQHLEEAQEELLLATGIPQADARLIVEAHDSTAVPALRELAGRMADYPRMPQRIAPHVALALVHNILQDSVAMRAEQQWMMDHADSDAKDWVVKLSLDLYGLQADKEMAYALLAEARERVALAGNDREDAHALAARLTDLAKFEEALPIVENYLAQDPEDLDFLIIRLNIAMGMGHLADMEKYRHEALRIDPRALDE